MSIPCFVDAPPPRASFVFQPNKNTPPRLYLDYEYFADFDIATLFESELGSVYVDCREQLLVIDLPDLVAHAQQYLLSRGKPAVIWYLGIGAVTEYFGSQKEEGNAVGTALFGLYRVTADKLVLFVFDEAISLSDEETHQYPAFTPMAPQQETEEKEDEPLMKRPRMQVVRSTREVVEEEK